MIRRSARADEKAVSRLVETARAADPDPWRDALRTGSGAAGAQARETLHKLASDEKALAAQPAESLLLLALRLKAGGDRDGAVQILRRAWRLRPMTFGSTSRSPVPPGLKMGQPKTSICAWSTPFGT